MTETIAPVGVTAPFAAPRPVGVVRVKAFHLGLLALIIAMPCLYWPKLFDSDTQPWVIIGAAFAFLFYWPGRPGSAAAPLNLSVTFVAVATLGVYYLRAPELDFFLRFAAITGTFVMLWHVASRQPSASIGIAVRATILIWFAVGVAQVAIVRLGLPIEIFGRFTPGRSGVPSLTAEPSFYGSLSVLQLMYVLSDKQWRRDGIFIAMAIGSVVLSGSLLSFVLLLVPAARLPTPLKILGGLLAILMLLVGVDVMSSDFFARLRDIDAGALGFEYLLQDASTNYRLGHAWFTWVAHLPSELFFLSSADFELEYNSWVSETPLFLMHDSDFILPSGGELLFRGGLVGAVLVWFILRKAWKMEGSLYDRLEKTTFVFLCLINPISLANPFFVFFIHKQYRQA